MAGAHIPGPYTFDPDESSVQHVESGMVLATIPAVEDHPCRDTEKDAEFEAELVATGHLLAAAPDLLIQLTGLLAFARFVIKAVDIDAEITTVQLRNKGELVAEVPLAVALANAEAAVAKAEGR